MEISAGDIHLLQEEGLSSTKSMKGRIRANNAPNPLPTPKTSVLSQGIGSFIAKTSEFDANVCSRMLSNKAVTLDKIPMCIFASQAFIAKCLDQRPKELIAYMNSWDQDQISTFIEKYDVLPEAMLGRLFVEGLNPDFVPKDIKLSLPFLRIVANANPGKLVAEILKKEDIQSVRLALRNLDDGRVEKLWNNGMPTAKLPTAKSFSGEFIERIKAADPERFESDIQKYAVNAMLRSKIQLQPLIKRSVRV